jgi:hypothetical protein
MTQAITRIALLVVAIACSACSDRDGATSCTATRLDTVALAVGLSRMDHFSGGNASDVA